MRALLAARSLLPVLAAGALLPLLAGSDCEGPTPTYPARAFVTELHASNSLGDSRRSQLGRPHPANAANEVSDLPGSPTPVYWSGTPVQVNIQMSPSVDLSALVLDANEAPAEDSCLLLDAIGNLADRGARTEPGSGLIGKKVVPHEYLAIVAPQCLLGDQPAGFVEPLSVQESIPEDEPIELLTPRSVEVPGRVEFQSGVPIEGAIVTLFDPLDPALFLGVTVTTASDGSFTLRVPEPAPDCGTPDASPCPTYDVVVAAPPDGSLPLPPIRLRGIVLPLGDGFTLLVRYPQLPIVPIRGDVVLEAGQTPYVTRLLVEGLIPAPPGSTQQFNGGLYRIETVTGADGRFDIDVPSGQYRITALPTYDDARTLDVAQIEFEVPANAGSVDNLQIEIPLANFARIEVLDDVGGLVPGADIILKMRERPHYHFYEQTTESLAGWSGPLMRGTYDIEVVPPQEQDPETGELDKSHARAHGTLEHSGESSILQIFLRRSDPFEGFIYGPPTADPGVPAEGVPGIQVLMLDPTTGEVLDETVTARENGAGFFRGVLPRQ